jgi:hypothetical protein
MHNKISAYHLEENRNESHAIPKKSKEKYPRASMRTPAAINITERVT